MYVFFFLLLYHFNFNHINGSLDTLDTFYKEKSRKRFNFRELIIAGMKLKKPVYNVGFCVTLFQNLFFSCFS